MAGGTWNEERVETLKALWEDGLSARVIADRLGGMTRNTVIGKLDRLGLLGKRDRPAPAEVTVATGDRPGSLDPAAIPAPDDVLEIQARLSGAAPSAEVTPDPVRAPPTRPVPADPAPGGSRIGIQELGTTSCRWPSGHPGTPAFGFCGAKAIAGRPYCDAHSRMAYEAPRERRRA